MKPKRILTIDGGGLRGVFSAAIIEQMEKLTGQQAHELFDCFCGTSAGSVIATGLASGLSATTLKEVFLKAGKQAFKHRSESAHSVIPTEKDERVFEEILRSLFRDPKTGRQLTAGDLKRHLAVPARNIKLGRIVFFGNFPPDRGPEVSFWDNAPVKENDLLWKIVRRSTALPPMFSLYGPYLDGGISPFANPSYAAYVGVQERLGWNPRSHALRFYSVGTGYHLSRVKQINKIRDDLDAMYLLMVNAMMQDISFLQHQVMKQTRDEGKIWYKRYNLRFDKEGFEEYGLSIKGRDFEKLASTAAPPVEELAQIGAELAMKVVEKEDFGLSGRQRVAK